MLSTAELIPYLQLYCRVDGQDHTTVEELLSFSDAAVAYLEGAGVPQPESLDSPRGHLYFTVLKALVLDMYDHRGSELETSTVENPAFRRMLNQLKLTI